MTVLATLHTERDGVDVSIDIAADYTPPGADVPYLANGDPGCPGDPEEVEITSATLNGEDIELTEEETERAIVLICENADHA